MISPKKAVYVLMMAMNIFALFIFFMYVPMLACNARLFGIINNEVSGTQLNSSVQVKSLDLNSKERGTNENVGKSSNHGRDQITGEAKDSKALLAGHVSIKPLVSVSWHVPVKNQAAASKPPGFFSDYSQPRTQMKHAGSETFESSSHVGLNINETAYIEESRRRALFLGSGTDHEVKETVDTNTNNNNDNNNKKAQEDVAAVMDYEPPHQTPPIHNRHT